MQDKKLLRARTVEREYNPTHHDELGAGRKLLPSPNTRRLAREETLMVVDEREGKEGRVTKGGKE